MNDLRNLTSEQRMIANAVDELTETFNHNYWSRCSDSDEFVNELWDELAKHGYLGVIIPEKYGGTGMGMSELSILIERFAYHGVPLLSFLNTVTMAAYPLSIHGTQTQKERFLEPLANGNSYFAFGITEPTAGTNSAKIQTAATKEGDNYVVDGQKTFITGADIADYILLVVRTTPYEEVSEGDRLSGGTLLIVDMDSDGIELQSLDLDMPKVERQYIVHFDDVAVPVDNRLGKEDDGFYHVFDALNPERIATASMSIGMGEFVLERAANYAKERAVFNAPIGSHQAVQHPLAEAKIQLELSKLATREAARAFESDKPSAGSYANMAKYTGSEAGDKAMDVAMQTFGGNAFSKEYDVIRLHNWTRFTRIAPINNEMVLNYIGETLLDLPRSY